MCRVLVLYCLGFTINKLRGISLFSRKQPAVEKSAQKITLCYFADTWQLVPCSMSVSSSQTIADISERWTSFVELRRVLF